MSSLFRAPKRSLKQTKRLMVDLAVFGRNYPPTGLRNEAEVREAYTERGMDFDQKASESLSLTA